MSVNNKKINLYNIRYKNSMKPIDWSYYTKFFPDRDRAVQALCMDTDLKNSEANDVVTEIFGRLINGEVEQRRANAEYSGTRYNSSYNDYSTKTSSFDSSSNIGKGIGCGCFSILYLFFGAIFSLVGIYHGKKK